MDSLSKDLSKALDTATVPDKYRHLANWCKYVGRSSHQKRFPIATDMVVASDLSYSTFLCMVDELPSFQVGRKYGLPWDNIVTEYNTGFKFYWFD
jgi:hypothetical protein